MAAVAPELQASKTIAFVAIAELQAQLLAESNSYTSNFQCPWRLDSWTNQGVLDQLRISQPALGDEALRPGLDDQGQKSKNEYRFHVFGL